MDYICSPLSDYINLSDRVSVSKCNKLSLQSYCTARKKYCSLYHLSQCTPCCSMIAAANLVLQSGVCSLQSVFKRTFPSVTYHTLNAKRKLLQMPLVAIQLQREVFLIELVEGVNYLKVLHFIDAFTMKSDSSKSLTKSDLNKLLVLARSDRERELVKYTAFRASGLSRSSARHHFGFENLSERVSKVEDSIKQAETIRQCIESLSRVKEKAFIQSLGFKDSSESEASSDDSDAEEREHESEEKEHESEEREHESEEREHESTTRNTGKIPSLSQAEFLELANLCEFNCFEIVDKLIEGNKDCHEDDAIHFLDNSYHAVMNTDLPITNINKLKLSYQAFKLDCCRRVDINRKADSLNGQIVSDAESDNADEYLGLHDITNERVKLLISKKRKQIRRRERYLKSKQLAERNFLLKRVSRKVRGILQTYPDIGDEIEKYVQECSVGADAWRRTGVLTFDGNTKVNSKVTYNRIRQHLVQYYKRNFSFGTVVQLCVARNKRRLSAKRYKGVAKVTSRRARKGFMLKFNPDAHWSSAFYRNLNLVQFSDGRHIVNINRDDASGFRLDTMATHRLHSTPMVQGSEDTTTYTDYVSKYKAVLQTTSYNFTKTNTTLEICAGIVKPVGLYPKNPTQHLADLEMLEECVDIKPAFINPITERRKLIECIRVDGAADEGPSHEEVQFMWTARHIDKSTQVTLVTARNSGSSYLNRVELQNGSLALAHSNLFIPSTLGGSCMESGKINKEKYKYNMDLATEVYMNRVSGCPCGDSVIHLYKGADSSKQQKDRKYILQYLKGSKEELKREEPIMYEYCEKVWNVRGNHMVKNLPSQYAFFLVCCYKPDCSHPLCSQQDNTDHPKWFESGPPVSFLPLPIPDPNRYYGNPDCTECKNFCCGHYLKPTETLATISSDTITKPPSLVLKESFDSLTSYPPSDELFSTLSRQVMLPVEDVKMWFEHLKNIKENRRKGALKAAETRKRKRKSRRTEVNYHCGVCHAPYLDFTSTEEQWIGCDNCDSWFHFICVGISVEPDTFKCSDCDK